MNFRQLLIIMITFLVPTTEAFAAVYSFTEIADTSVFASINGTERNSINNNGSVAFFAQDTNFVVKRGEGGSLISIAGPFGTLTNTPSINNLGMVVFQTGTSMMIGDGSTLSTVFSGDINGFGPVINDNNTIAFVTSSQIHLLKGGVVTTVASKDNSPFTTFGDISLNNLDQVAFTAGRLGDTSGIFVGDDIFVKTLIDTSGEFSGFGAGPSINDAGVVAALMGMDAGGEGIFAISDTSVTKIAESGGVFSSFGGAPDINNKGDVVFTAHIIGGGDGIFTGPDLLADKVIAFGDVLFGSKVVGLSFNEAINDFGQIAFRATLENGISGIYRADPINNQTVVPEPSTLLLLAIGLLGAIVTHKTLARPSL